MQVNLWTFSLPVFRGDVCDLTGLTSLWGFGWRAVATLVNRFLSIAFSVAALMRFFLSTELRDSYLENQQTFCYSLIEGMGF